MDSLVQFSAPCSIFTPNYWSELYERKLNDYKLDESSRSITCNLTRDGFSFDKDSFHHSNDDDINHDNISFHHNNDNDINHDNISFHHNNDNNVNHNILTAKGEMINVNTKTQFQDIDKKLLIDNLGKKLIESMKNGEAVNNPSILLQFTLISYADLKQYSFFYWLCCPAVIPNNPFTFINEATEVDKILLKSIYDRLSFQSSQHVFAIMKDTLECLTLSDAWSLIHDEKIILVIFDIMGIDRNYPWHLRNLLALLAIHSVKTISIINLRNSLMRKIHSSKTEDLLNADKSVLIQVDLGNQILESYKTIGWESNQRGKPGARNVNCNNFLNTKDVMKQAVDLNIKLMKWRQWPSLEIEKMSKTSVLLFGAGTLGCAVARCLLGYGFCRITFVDNGKVSYSNPVRQSLFEFEDCEKHEFKAIAAANRLKRIFPGIESEGIVLTVPMPGHELNHDDPETKSVIAKIDELIKVHDVCFALTDTRESRWLPTMLCSRYDKLMINAALGFDSYLVMRHGSGLPEDETSQVKKPEDETSQVKKPEDETRLGCYFCQDIVAATNSLKDRTLDQQCTVTRPGLSFIVAGLATEMMVAILHSPHGSKHPCNDSIDSIPHQIRGSVDTFNHQILMTPSFKCCTACSMPIIETYRNQGIDFIIDVCNDPNILSNISGIDKMLQKIDLNQCIDSDDDF